ncbi:MAG: acyl-CoA/acyl-ACP dehydrogenase [Deltaproteobacteria bacterium]|nr:acyl-CoA/acyl-ACP dehydrogenase [Deltaproteobacteria bacterium]MBW2445550.1 acyl-CoA/acyl-ACP dehydrogenase [Deltaproteobacteria bacterium]
MDLDFSEEQQMLRDMVRSLCNEYSPVEVVRAMEDDPKGVPEELWKQLGELGLLGLLIPESYGGAEQGMLEAALVYEEFGRALAPSPHFVSSVVSARLLLAAGSEEQKQTWLPQIASGEAVLTPAWLEPDRGFGDVGVQLRVEADGDGFKLTGTKRHVLFASTAARLVVLARNGDDVEYFLVDPNASGVTLTQQRSLAADTQYDVEFAGVRVAASDRIPGGWAVWNSVMLDGVILLAAWAMGGAERAVEVTTDYAKERKQFDKPLGAFQAISHYLADATTNVDGGKGLVYEAAWARGEGRDVARLAPMAKLFACQTYRDVTAMCQQVWGGVGFTIEYDIQLYFRRAKQLQITWWDQSYLEELIAADVLDREAS